MILLDSRHSAQMILALTLLACSHDWRALEHKGDTTTASGGGGSSAGGGGGGGADGGGGGSDDCGNGDVDIGEDCDDANDLANDGCTACKFDCKGPGELDIDHTPNCYLLVLTIANWHDAQAVCLAWEGDLVALNKADELVDLAPHYAQVVGQAVWTGGNDIGFDVADGGTFVWSNGSAWSYAPWILNSPDTTADNTKDCVRTNNTVIVDTTCDELRPYICERSAKVMQQQRSRGTKSAAERDLDAELAAENAAERRPELL